MIVCLKTVTFLSLTLQCDFTYRVQWEFKDSACIFPYAVCLAESCTSAACRHESKDHIEMWFEFTYDKTLNLCVCACV
jgi:hypothetical protein